mgnify:CR=1 FL=1
MQLIEFSDDKQEEFSIDLLFSMFSIFPIVALDCLGAIV